MFRQGDLLIVKVNQLPQSREEEANADMKEGIVERGETTGHAHRLLDTIRGRARRFVGDPALYLDVTGGGTSLVHEEHAPINLDEGLYRVIRQREFDPHREERERMVID